MRRAIFLRAFLVALLSVSLCCLLSSAMLSLREKGRTEGLLANLALSASLSHRPGMHAKQLSALAGNVRVTILSAEGAALSDSEKEGAGLLGSYADCPDVKAARRGFASVAESKGSAFGENLAHASSVAGSGEIVRLTAAYPGIFQAAASLLPGAALIAASAALLCFLMASRISAGAAKPLLYVASLLSKNGTGDPVRYNSSFLEADKTVLEIQEKIAEISSSHQSLLIEHEKVEFILSGMAEGFIMIDGQKNILLCNKRAKQFLRIQDSVNRRNIWTVLWDAKIGGAIDNALLQGKSASIEWRAQKDLLLRASISPSPIGSAPGETGATLMLADITSEKELEKQKQDFFSTASHELKTPV
ncbi:MAG: hypothetical protein LBC69_04260, partial [Eubacteriaceae bacterium]|nr:hypothetical protein [Eubacteriaceae bacterium]